VNQAAYQIILLIKCCPIIFFNFGNFFSKYFIGCRIIVWRKDAANFREKKKVDSMTSWAAALFSAEPKSKFERRIFLHGNRVIGGFELKRRQ
jgi:hypothetical protein